MNNSTHLDVTDNQDLLAVTMVELRDLVGWDRLTHAALRAIDDATKQTGLGYFPRPLPDSRHATVRLFRLGTPLGRLAEAVLDPTEHGDKLLRETSSGNAMDILDRIRVLACEE